MTSVILIDGRVARVWDLTEQPKPNVRMLLFDRDLAERGAALEGVASAGEFWFGWPVFVPSLRPGRLKVLARYAAAARAQAIARMPEQRRIARLLAFAHHLQATAQDDALDVLDMLVENLLDRVEHDGERARLRTVRDPDAAALRLRDACLIVLDETRPDAKLRAEVLTRDGARIAIFYTKLYGRLLKRLLAADYPHAAPELRQALRVTNTHLITSIDRARLPKAA